MVSSQQLDADARAMAAGLLEQFLSQRLSPPDLETTWPSSADPALREMLQLLRLQHVGNDISAVKTPEKAQVVNLFIANLYTL
jgi:hypothetical protein